MLYRDPIEMVNDYLQRFARHAGARIEPLDASGYTDLRRGACVIGVNILPARDVLLVLTRIGAVPQASREALYRKLLELNFLSTAECSFSIDEQRDAVYLRALRGLRNLDYGELERLLETLGDTADRLRAQLPDLSG